MHRRQFLKEVALWCGGLTLSIPCFKVVEAAPLPQKNPSLLAIGRAEDYIALTANVLEPLGSMSAFVKSGDKVVIKPNIGWDRNPMEAANTHPLVVKSLVLLALDAGAGEVKVFDRTCNEERRCYTNSGIKDAIESIKDKRVKSVHGLHCILSRRQDYTPLETSFQTTTGDKYLTARPDHYPVHRRRPPLHPPLPQHGQTS